MITFGASCRRWRQISAPPAAKPRQRDLAGPGWGGEGLTRTLVRGNLPFVVTYQSAREALGEPQRLRILTQLRRGPASVTDLARELPISRPAVSQHLRVLHEQSLVTYDTVGTRNFYRADQAGFAVVREWLDDFWSTAFDSFVDFARTPEGKADPNEH
jgi:DNA-binding transcriptional ArsR family regulator